MQGAYSQSGTTRNRRKVDRVPAANTPLSAACRCASYLPSDPSVLSPRNVDLVSNDRVFLLLKPTISIPRTTPTKLLPTKFVTLAVTVSVFLRQNSAY